MIPIAFTEVAWSDSTKTRARVGGREDMREELPWSNQGHPSPYRWDSANHTITPRYILLSVTLLSHFQVRSINKRFQRFSESDRNPNLFIRTGNYFIFKNYQKTVQCYHNTYQKMEHKFILLTSKCDRLEYYSFYAAEVQCASNIEVLMSAANITLFNHQLIVLIFKNIPVRCAVTHKKLFTFPSNWTSAFQKKKSFEGRAKVYIDRSWYCSKFKEKLKLPHLESIAS